MVISEDALRALEKLGGNRYWSTYLVHAAMRRLDRDERRLVRALVRLAEANAKKFNRHEVVN